MSATEWNKTGDPCVTCGVTYDECTAGIFGKKQAACCSRCAYTDTHNERDKTSPLSAKLYRKKPVEIEAMHFERGKSPSVGYAIAAWCGGRFNTDAKPSDPTDVRYSISIPTLEGVMTADEGDYIIRGVQGEFYPCKPDIFHATYEEV